MTSVSRITGVSSTPVTDGNGGFGGQETEQCPMAPQMRVGRESVTGQGASALNFCLRRRSRPAQAEGAMKSSQRGTDQGRSTLISGGGRAAQSPPRPSSCLAVWGPPGAEQDSGLSGLSPSSPVWVGPTHRASSSTRQNRTLFLLCPTHTRRDTL